MTDNIDDGGSSIDEQATIEITLDESAKIIYPQNPPLSEQNDNSERNARMEKRNASRKWEITGKESDETVIHEYTTQLDGTFEIRDPYSYIKDYLDENIMKIIVEETNKYAIQKNPNKPVNLTSKELEQWIGLIYYFSISKLPNAKMHWSQQLPSFANYASKIMSRNRYQDIKSNFHLVDNNEIEGSNDKMIKVRPLIEHVRSKFKKIQKIQNLSVDEQIVPFKGASSLKQYLPNKIKKLNKLVS